MAITQAICTSFKSQMLSGTHDLENDTLKIALYDDATATLNADTTAYTTTGEVTGSGYVAGGETLTGATISTDGSVVFVDFTDATWANATISADGALIYNSTAVGSPAVMVIKFATTARSTDGNFTVQFPTNDSASALIRFD